MDTRSPLIRVVLVDDQALVRTAIASLIRSAVGMEVVATAGTVEEAIRYADELRPQVVLMDILPQPSVFEGAREIQRRCPTTRLVLLDDYPRDAHVREALRMGATGYLTKQQSFGQIEAALRQAARGDRVFAPEISRRLVLSAEGVRLSPASQEHPLAALTAREADVLVHLAQGFSVKQCAKALGIGVSTVGNHKSRLMKKLNVHKTVELTRLAMRAGLIPEEHGTGGPAAPHFERGVPNNN